MTRSRANFLLLLTAFIWGTAFVAQATAMRAVGPFLFLAIRFFIGAAVILPLAIRECRRFDRPMSVGHYGLMMATSLAIFTAAILQQAGLLTTSVTNAAFFTVLYVAIVPFLVLLIYRKRPHAVVWPTSALCVAGTWLISGSDFSALNYGDLLVISGAFFWALHVVLVSLTARSTGRPITVACFQFTIVGILGLAGAIILEPISVAAIASIWIELLYTGLLSTGVAYTLQVYAQHHTQPADAAIILSAETLFAAMAGTILLAEHLTSAGWMGCALILFAIVSVELAPRMIKQHTG